MVDHLPCEPITDGSVFDAPTFEIDPACAIMAALRRGMSFVVKGATLTMVSDGSIRALPEGLWIDRDGGAIYEVAGQA